MAAVIVVYGFCAVATTVLMFVVMQKLFPKTYPSWKCIALGLAWPYTWLCEVFGAENALLR